MSEEVLTARITADVSEAINGFRQVDSEAKNLKVSVGDVARGFSGLVTSSYSLYRAYDMVARVQADAKATQEDITKAYLHAASLAIPGVISGIDSMMRIYTTLQGSLTLATIAQWLYNKALIVTHALSGPAGWAILGVAAAVTAGALAWMAMNQQQQEYNKTLTETTRDFRDLKSELATMSPIERLQREYQIVKEYYGYTVSIGNVNVSGANLGSSLDRERTAEDIAKQIGRRVALRGVPGR